jgi:hypothetical protein
VILFGELVFYIPFFIMLSILFYFIKWTKAKVSVLFLTLPAAYFTFRIFTFHHWEPTSVLAKHFIGLMISITLLISWLYFLYKKQK